MKRTTVITATSLFLLAVILAAGISEAQVRSAAPIRAAERASAFDDVIARAGESEVVVENRLSVSVRVFIGGRAAGSVRARGMERFVVADGNHTISVQSSDRSGGTSRDVRFNALSQRVYFRATSPNPTTVSLTREDVYEIAVGGGRRGGGTGVAPVASAVPVETTPAPVAVAAVPTPTSAPAAVVAVPAPNTFTDSRDGQTYRYVTIGTQTWMAENLNYNASGSVCYDNDDANCAKYGRLYNLATVMAACPAGWRLPACEDWNTLVSTAGDSLAGRNLKSSTGWDGTDEFGFSAMPSGFSNINGSFDRIGVLNNWWSAPEGGITARTSRYRRMVTGYDSVYDYSWGDSFRISVRCIRN
jgi:uncharacterized protein (TIGR02145 family)